MESMGNRWRCRRCNRTLSKRRRLPRLSPRLLLPRLSSNGLRPRILSHSARGLPLTRRPGDGRWIVGLGVGHPWANSAGWQYLYRVLVAWYLSRPLHPDEQVHHVDRDMSNDDPRNLQVVVALDGSPQYNHKFQRVAVVAEWSEEEGRIVEYEEPQEPVPF